MIPLACPLCGRTLELAEIWEPKRGFVWNETLAGDPPDAQGIRDAMRQLQEARAARYRQLAFNFDTS